MAQLHSLMVTTFIIALLYYAQFKATTGDEITHWPPIVWPSFEEQCTNLANSKINSDNGLCYHCKRFNSDRMQSIEDLNEMCSSMLDGRLIFPYKPTLNAFLATIDASGYQFTGAVNARDVSNRTSVATRRIGWLHMTADNGTEEYARGGDPLLTNTTIWVNPTYPYYADGRCTRYNAMTEGLLDLAVGDCSGGLAMNVRYTCEYEPTATPDVRPGCKLFPMKHAVAAKAWHALNAHVVQVNASPTSTVGRIECAVMCMRFKRCQSFSINTKTGDCRLKRVHFVEGTHDIAHMEIGDVSDHSIYNVQTDSPQC